MTESETARRVQKVNAAILKLNKARMLVVEAFVLDDNPPYRSACERACTTLIDARWLAERVKRGLESEEI